MIILEYNYIGYRVEQLGFQRLIFDYVVNPFACPTLYMSERNHILRPLRSLKDITAYS